MEEYLAKTNSIPLEGLKYRLGRKLDVDAAQETITNNADAVAMLTRNYRAPFTVPEKVA
jgi:hypothetical protein